MEAAEAADTIQDLAHEQHTTDDAFRRDAAVMIGILALLLAITSLSGEHAAKEMVNANILAADAYAFFQAKNIRQTSTQLAADDLGILLLTQPTLPAEVRARIEARIEGYEATVRRYESDPATGEGKQELLVTAQGYEEEREHAHAQEQSLAYAQALLQIAIVLGSVAIVATSRWLLGGGLALGGIGLLLLLNGYLLVVHLPTL
jgi:hypothetical protein